MRADLVFASVRLLDCDRCVAVSLFDIQHVAAKPQSTRCKLLHPVAQGLFQLGLEDVLPFGEPEIARAAPGFGKAIPIIVVIAGPVAFHRSGEIGFVQTKGLQCARALIVQKNRAWKVHRAPVPLKKNEVNAVDGQQARRGHTGRTGTNDHNGNVFRVGGH